MSQRTPEVDAYIAKQTDFARPILAKIRDAFHAGCPKLEERIKWGVPSFEYMGMLGGMATFKKHVSMGFWKARLIPEFEEVFGRPARASAMGGKFEKAADLPTKQVLVAMVKQAKRLNEEGAKDPKLAKKQATGTRITPPADLLAALAKSPKAKKTFEAFPPGAKREYVEWLTEAKREATRAKRLAQAIEWMAEGKKRNWKYGAR